MSSLSPYIRAEQYQALYSRLSEAKERLASAKNVHVLLRAVRQERMVADNNVDAAILQEKLYDTRLKVAKQRKETEALEAKYSKTSKDGTAQLESHEHKGIVLAAKADEVRRVVASDPAERLRYRLQQDKTEYLEAATSAMQHFIERERKKFQKKVKKLTTQFSPPEVMATLQKNTRPHRFWTRSARDSVEALVSSHSCFVFCTFACVIVPCHLTPFSVHL